MTDTRVKVFVVDDYPGIRVSLVQFMEEEFDVIGAAGSAEETLEAACLPEADVVIVDVSLPRVSGIDLVRELLKRWPRLRCMMLTGHDSLPYLKRALAAGARGYLRKDDPEEILEGVRHVHAGDLYIGRYFRGQVSGDELVVLAAAADHPG